MRKSSTMKEILVEQVNDGMILPCDYESYTEHIDD